MRSVTAAFLFPPLGRLVSWPWAVDRMVMARHSMASRPLAEMALVIWMYLAGEVNNVNSWRGEDSRCGCRGEANLHRRRIAGIWSGGLRLCGRSVEKKRAVVENAVRT